MKLNNYIALSAFSYPSLYYHKDYQYSRARVLDHLFLCIGGGTEYINPKNKIGAGWFGTEDVLKHKRLSKEDVKRVESGEPICTITCHYDERMFAQSGFIRADWYHIDHEKNAFLSDFLKQGLKYLDLNHYERGKVNPKDYDCFIEVYPETNELYLQSLLRNERIKGTIDVNWYPYPFSIEYTGMWDRTNKCFIPKEMIMPDWVAGIVEIYEKTLNWCQDDSKYMANRYYNWAEDTDIKLFQKEWDKDTQPGKPQFCKDYAIPQQDFADIREAARAVVAHNRKKRIDECNQILSFYRD